jgi:hypothetical protein
METKHPAREAKAESTGSQDDGLGRAYGCRRACHEETHRCLPVIASKHRHEPGPWNTRQEELWFETQAPASGRPSAPSRQHIGGALKPEGSPLLKVPAG